MKKFKVNGKEVEANSILDAISKCKDSDLDLLREYYKEKQPNKKMELRTKLKEMGLKEGVSGVYSSSIMWVELNGKRYEVKNLEKVTPLDSVKDYEEVKSLSDSSCKDKQIPYKDLRQFCIENNYYTKGSVSDYDELLANANAGSWNFDEIAYNIANHSNGVWVDEVKTKLKARFGDSCKDAEEYMIIDKDEGKYIYNLDLSAARYLTTFDAKKADKFSLGEAKRVIEELKKYNLTNYTTSEYLGDSVKDADSNIDYLIEEEEKAIEDYKNAITTAGNDSLANLYKHILEEEIEHRQELLDAKDGNYKINDYEDGKD